MGNFQGKLRLADVPESAVDAEFQIDGGDVVVISEAGTIGQWKLEDMVASGHRDGFLLTVEGEELIFDTESEEMILVLARVVPGSAETGQSVFSPPPATPLAAAAEVPSAPPIGAPPRQRRRAPQPLSPPWPAAWEPPPPASTHSQNGNHPLSVAALLFGTVGTVLALLPRLFPIAIAAGTIGLVLGLFARYEIKKGLGQKGNDVATAGAALGAIAIVMGMIVALN